MEQEKINYRDIMDLGFKEEPQSDDVYFDQYGYQYGIITKDLTDNICARDYLIYIDWAKETMLCEMIRADRDGNIQASMPIRDFFHLKEIIEFFTKNDRGTINYGTSWSGTSSTGYGGDPKELNNTPNNDKL